MIDAAIAFDGRTIESSRIFLLGRAVRKSRVFFPQAPHLIQFS